jgi:hypothetical protein
MAVNLSPVGGVAAQFFDNDGNVLSGGRIYTYAAGTSTPAATYTTGAGSIAHSNPIILDSAGRVPTGEIWLTDGISYKFVLNNSIGTLIGTYDNISGINSNFVNFLAEQEIQTATANQTVFTLTTTQYQPNTNTLSVFVDGVNQYGPGAQYSYIETSSTVVTFNNGLHVGALVKFTTTQLLSGGTLDSSQVVYDPPFTGGVETTVEAKLAQYFSVKDFGAVGNGVADDTAAFQAAIDACANGTVFIPTGIYNINDALKIEYNLTTGKSCVNLVGTGYGSTLLWNGGDNNSMIWYEGVTLNAGFYSMTVVQGLFLKNQVNANGLIGIRIGNAASPLGINAGVANVTIRNNRLLNFDIGIQTEYESDGINILENVIEEYNSYGAYIAGSSCVRVHYNYFQLPKTGAVGVYCEYTTIDISNNLIQGPATNVVGDIWLKNVLGFTITNNYLEHASAGTQFGIFINNTQSGYIGSNVIQGFQGADCIYIDQTSRNVNIGPNTYASVVAAPSSLIKTIAGAREINILSQQSFTSGPAPVTRLVGTGYGMVCDDGYWMLGQQTYSANPNAGISMAETGVFNIGNNARPDGWGFTTFSRSGVQIGSVTQSGTTGVLYNTTSDQRLKKDLGIATTTDVISRTVIHDFEWPDGAKDRGVFAQEAELVKPSAVTKGSDEINDNGDLIRPWGVDYSKYIPDIIVELQKLKEDFEAYKTSHP